MKTNYKTHVEVGKIRISGENTKKHTRLPTTCVSTIFYPCLCRSKLHFSAEDAKHDGFGFGSFKPKQRVLRVCNACDSAVTVNTSVL